MFFLYSLIYTLAFVLASPLFFLRKEKYAAGFARDWAIIPNSYEMNVR
jgi:hypothetical protein